MKKGDHMTHKLIRSVKQHSGFTMIELLIVITILGILAVAVLSAINPIEQINRGRDTGSRSDAEQLLSAIDRYYAFNGYYPWVSSASEQDDSLDFTPINNIERKAYTTLSASEYPNLSADVSAGSPIPGCNFLEVLASGDTANDQLSEEICPASSELKVSFIQRISATGSNQLFVFNRGQQGDSTYICFVPKSAAFTTEATDRCEEKDGPIPNDFPTSDNTTVEGSACNAGGSEPTAEPTMAFNLGIVPMAFAQIPTLETVEYPTENMVCLP